MSVAGIVEFLTARLDEDQAAAEAAGATRSGKIASWRVDCDCPGIHVNDCYERRVEGDNITIYDEGGHDEDQARHIARWDPARVLAEVAAKRRIVELHTSGSYRTYHCDNGDHIQEWQCERAKEPYTEHRYCEVCSHECVELPLLAAPYADHPDYDTAWRVE